MRQRGRGAAEGGSESRVAGEGAVFNTEEETGGKAGGGQRAAAGSAAVDEAAVRDVNAAALGGQCPAVAVGVGAVLERDAGECHGGVANKESWSDVGPHAAAAVENSRRSSAADNKGGRVGDVDSGFAEEARA